MSPEESVSTMNPNGGIGPAVSSRPHRKILMGALLVGVLIVIALGLSSLAPSSMSYVISGVPYVGIYNHKGDLARINGPSGAAVYSLLQYWDPKDTNIKIAESIGVNPEYIREKVTPRPLDIDRIADLFSENGYDVNVEPLTLNEFSNYINDKIRTPLFIFLPLKNSLTLPTDARVATLIIGVDQAKKELIVHHYWYGNNFTISFDNFRELHGSQAGGAYTVLIAQPKNLNDILATKKGNNNSPAYLPRTDLMQRGGIMLENYAVGLNLVLTGGSSDEVLNYLQAVTEDQNFESLFPPYFQVDTYNMIADQLLRIGKYNEAEQVIEKAIGLNSDLDQPKGSWPGFDAVGRTAGNEGRHAVTYRILGHIKHAQGEHAAALQAYREAFKINPDMDSESLEAFKAYEAKYGP